MKSLELKPTEENLVRTFIDDSIGRDQEVLRFAKTLDSLEGNFSVSLDGKWGSGKTFFVKQVKMIFDSYNESLHQTDNLKLIHDKCHKFDEDFSLKPTVCVYYDSWENDDNNDPMLSLVYSICQTPEFNAKFKEKTDLKSILGSILEFFSGRNWGTLFEALGSSSLESLKNSKEVEDKIKDFLDDLLTVQNARLIIFIDELDRCKPSYAVKLLERIKHYLSNDRIIFVFSINSTELIHTLKNFYGSDFDADRYLDRFFDFPVQVPPLKVSNYYSLVGFNYTHYVYDVICAQVVDSFHLEMREIGHFLQLARVVAPNLVHSSGSVFSYEESFRNCATIFVSILIGLSLIDSDRYNSFINGEDYSPLIEIGSLDNLKNYFSRVLLFDNESFGDNQKDENIVSLDSRLIEVYNKIFKSLGPVNDLNSSCEQIGHLILDSNIKNELIKIAGSSSKYLQLDP